MKLTSFVILLFILLPYSVGKEGVKVSVRNSTERTLTNVKVMASSETFVVFDSIAPNEVKSKFLDMTKTPLRDGSYTLEFTRSSGEDVSQTSGYFSNGSPLNTIICYGIDEISVYTFFDELCD